MANMCFFDMLVKGTHENIENFYNAMTHKGNIWMGRGAEAEIHYENEKEVEVANITGSCKWSVWNALTDNSISMRDKPHLWKFDDINISTLEFLTLDEASEKWDLAIEAYSEEVGVGFQEHYLIKSGNFWEDECVDYIEYGLEEFETKEEAEQNLERKITDEEWDSGLIIEGGFGEWHFSI